MKDNFAERLKQAKLAVNNDLNTVEQRVIRNEEKNGKITNIFVIFLENIFLVMMVFKICLLISQLLIGYS